MTTITNSLSKLAVSLSLVLAITACSGVNNDTETGVLSDDAHATQSPVAFFNNQVGFLPEQQKHVVIRSSQPVSFVVTQTSDGATILRGTTSAPAFWALAGENTVLADVSEISEPGLYRLTVGDNHYTTFKVSEERLNALHDAAIKAYYYNRASTALDPAFAGKWHRQAGHPDSRIVNLNQPEQTFSSAKGWYDAGDYNKYIVNSGISTYTLMRAYLDYPEFYADRHWNIPESTNGKPDLLDEVKWNLDWMLTMQDSDGGVFHKLTTLTFAPAVMPEQATEQRYVVAKSTAATLNFAAVMATASRLYPHMKDTYLAVAQQAWQWALNHQNIPYTNPTNVNTGEYGDNTFNDEFAWAATELLLATGDMRYAYALDRYLDAPATPDWSDTMGLAYLSLLSAAGQNILDEQRFAALKMQFLNYADSLVSTSNDSPFKTAMTAADFVWGSNGVAMNHAMVLATAYRLAPKQAYRDAFTGLIDYVLGKNPTGYSYVTGFGERTPHFIHHRQSQADGIAEPVPGFLVGGAQNGHQDNCVYTSSLPATSYLDNDCSYSTNEVAINWNAPFVYALAALLAKPQ